MMMMMMMMIIIIVIKLIIIIILILSIEGIIYYVLLNLGKLFFHSFPFILLNSFFCFVFWLCITKSICISIHTIDMYIELIDVEVLFYFSLKSHGLNMSPRWDYIYFLFPPATYFIYFLVENFCLIFRSVCVSLNL